MYNCSCHISDRWPWSPRPSVRIIDEEMAFEENRPTTRSGSDDPLVREVRWRLFRRDELPARLRRLQRLEHAAAAESNGHRPPAGEPRTAR